MENRSKPPLKAGARSICLQAARPVSPGVGGGVGAETSVPWERQGGTQGEQAARTEGLNVLALEACGNHCHFGFGSQGCSFPGKDEENFL